MNQANTDLISPRPVADTSPQYFNMGMMRRQQNLAESDFALKANKEEAAAQLQNSRLAAAKRVFANGITEEAIGQYGAETGDVETAQKMLGQLKTQQEMQGLKDAHGTVLLSHAKLQDEIVKHANDERAQIFGDIDLNDTTAENMRRISARWQYLRSVNSHLADYDEKNNLIRGGELPEQPDLNMIAAIKSRATSLQDQAGNKLREKELVKKDADKSFQIGMKEDQFITGRLSKLSDALDPTSKTRNLLAIRQGIVDRAQRLETLENYVNAYQNGDADSRQIEELAIGLNALLSGANVGAQKQVEALVPKSAIGNARKMQEWLTNNPTGLKQQKFVERMVGTITNEKETAKQQIKQTLFQRLAQFNDLRKKDPQRWEEVVRSAGIDPAEYDEWVASGYKKKDAVKEAGKVLKESREGGQKFKIISVEDK